MNPDRRKFRPDPGVSGFAITILLAAIARAEIPFYLGILGIAALALWMSQLVEWLTK